MNWDEKLKIDTEGMDESKTDYHHFRYEPTPYEVLERLIDSGWITEKNHVLDVGCGKGRVSFFLSMTTGCICTGVDFNEDMIQRARMNQESCLFPERVQFVCCSAEEYRVENEDCFYFFNPFSEKILRTVISHILTSYHQNPRKIRLFFYYPSADALAYLMCQNELIFLDEIDCDDLFEGSDERERIVVFETME